jgi:hypothetical protein
LKNQVIAHLLRRHQVVMPQVVLIILLRLSLLQPLRDYRQQKQKIYLSKYHWISFFNGGNILFFECEFKIKGVFNEKIKLRYEKNRYFIRHGKFIS